MRGVSDVAGTLSMTLQRFAAVAGLVALFSGTVLLDLPIHAELLQLGRSLELSFGSLLQRDGTAHLRP